MITAMVAAQHALEREGVTMLRYLVFFRYGMAARRHPHMDHVPAEQAAFARSLTRPTPFPRALAAAPADGEPVDDVPMVFRMAAE
jgi:hypothetical protein